jgi:quercetin dioxygenase-like cupin family protein
MTGSAQTAERRGATDGDAYWLLGGLFTILADGAATGGRAGVTAQHLPGGMTTPLHRHPEDETFHVVEGAIGVLLDGRRIDVEEGGVAHVPGGATHAFTVVSETARLVVFSAPAGHEEFFRAAGVPAPERTLPPPSPPDMDRLMAAAQAHGVEILGPPPAELGA